MNRIVLIGNGFDLAHGLKTSYKNFIDWYWKDWGEKLYRRENPLIPWDLKDVVRLVKEDKELCDHPVQDSQPTKPL